MLKKLVLCAVAAGGLLAIFGEAQPVDARPRVRVYAGPYGTAVRWRGGRVRAYRSWNGYYAGGYYGGGYGYYGAGNYGAQPCCGSACGATVAAPFHGGTVVNTVVTPGDSYCCNVQPGVIAQPGVIYDD